MMTTTRNALTSAGFVGLGLLVFGCSKILGSSGGGSSADPQASAATTTAAPAVNPASPPSGALAPSTGAAATTTAANGGGPTSPIDARAALYSLSDIKPLADNCATPTVILSDAPMSVGDAYGWPASRQAFLANQQFKIVSGQPTAPGQVRLAPYHYNPFGTAVYALVATCSDGTTCNQIAAMYKAVVRSSKPQLVCGTPPGISGDPVSFSWAADPKDNLPPTGNAEAECARVSACTLTYRPETPGDPLLACQKGATDFKIGCASRYPCSEVIACTGALPVSAATPATAAPVSAGGACTTDGNCASGLSCYGGNCLTSCGPCMLFLGAGCGPCSSLGQVCESSKCVAKACTQDSDCSQLTGTKCNGGRCSF